MRESTANATPNPNPLNNVTSVSGISRGDTGIDITLPSYADFSMLSAADPISNDRSTSRSTSSPNRSPKAPVSKGQTQSFHYYEGGNGFKGDRDKIYYNNNPGDWKSKNGGMKLDKDRSQSPPKGEKKKKVDWNAGDGSSKLKSASSEKKAVAAPVNPNTLQELTHLLSLKSDLPLSTPPELQAYLHKLETNLSQATMQVSRLSLTLTKLEKQHSEFKISTKEQIKKKDESISKLRANNAKLREERDGEYTRERGDIGVMKEEKNAKGYNSFR
ncbi:hypothetical protein TL16_g02179 [Triparma laevis f. inornata]|uniref:Uncharacterized protein n=2 Tax=Triparma laevis TaxID=1534972 RepID=A0A9W7FEN0_9STRA|nr:hypothetical protein TL16_g02179 [Triparma laevis f. inornata]GMI10694.1 hypothetical protein TrLO_g9015 [Triparma laevis f. longispina]